MDLSIKRGPSLQGATIGFLFVEDKAFCYTLEDEVREVEGQPVSAWKIHGVTAIPRGRFKLGLHDSPHFGCVVPILLGVPGYSYVLIHWGNKAEDTDGCILVGMKAEGNLLYQSKLAWGGLFALIKRAMDQGEEVFITIA